LKKIVLIAGARPNFMKIAPIIAAIQKARKGGALIDYALIHTGQHYDQAMSDSFFVQLKIPVPDLNLEAGGGSAAEQTAAIMVRFEGYLASNPCNLVLVVGDVTSTLACSIVAKKLNIPVAHVEGGIRSGDRSMPEEINRLVTDSISDFFFTTTVGANNNLVREGKSEDQLFLVGNTMIDTLNANLSRLQKPVFWDEFNLRPQNYFVLTLHRPSNVDNREKLKSILDVLEHHADTVVFPVHPRTRKNMVQYELDVRNIKTVDPLGYLEFIYLVKHARGVITDSGGITEETTVLGIPCITLRDTTERPETCEVGTNELIGSRADKLAEPINRIMTGQWKKGRIPDMWDGNTAERIVDVILRRILIS
jgi:UDP-N-acetylglucosamine 2-epimerase (non-hydrolysing)